LADIALLLVIHVEGYVRYVLERDEVVYPFSFLLILVL